MKNNKRFLNSLVYNNKLLLICSFFAAVILWLAVTLVLSPIDEKTIENVPVKIEASQAMQSMGLHTFGTSDYYTDVVITGKRYEISSVSADDIIVKADTKYVNTAGRYTLNLVASVRDGSDDFEISSMSLGVVDAYFDVEKRAEFNMKVEISAPEGIAPEGYYVGDYMLSEPTVTITGPETEVDKIIGVSATANIESRIKSTKVFPCSVSAYNSIAEEPKYLTYKTKEAAVMLTIPVYKVVELNTSVSFENSPSDYISSPLNYSVFPSKAKFGVAENKIESIGNKMVISSIDFSNLHKGENVIKVAFDSESAVLLDDGIEEFTVTINIDNVSEKTFEIPSSKIVFNGIQNGTTPKASGADSISVLVIGPQSSLDKLTPDSFALKADLSAVSAGDVPLTVGINDSGDCWAYGEYITRVEF